MFGIGLLLPLCWRRFPYRLASACCCARWRAGTAPRVTNILVIFMNSSAGAWPRESRALPRALSLGYICCNLPTTCCSGAAARQHPGCCLSTQSGRPLVRFHSVLRTPAFPRCSGLISRGARWLPSSCSGVRRGTRCASGSLPFCPGSCGTSRLTFLAYPARSTWLRRGSSAFSFLAWLCIYRLSLDGGITPAPACRWTTSSLTLLPA